MNKKITALLLAIGLTAGMLAACGTKEDSGTRHHPDEAGLIYATAKDINDMNPHLYTGSMPAQGMIYESLVENTKDGIKPLLAESWAISADGKTYTFRLRKDVTFHDGAPFNAEAVKLNIDAVLANASKHSWIKLSTAIVSAEAVDEHTFRLELAEPYYPALLELSMTRPFVFISPNDFIGGQTKDGVAGYHGTGPYIMDEHQTEQYAVFTANEHYWGDAPKVKSITAKVLPAGETTFLALRKGEVNFAFTDDRGTDSISVESMEQLASAGDYQIVRSEPMNTKMIVANTSKPGSPAGELAVREAIWHAIDRETISARIFSGTETPAETLFSSNVNYAGTELRKRPFDIAKAEELLERAGWIRPEHQELREKAGVPLTMKMYYDTNSSSQKTQAEMVQHALRQAGMGVELIGEESSSIATRRSAGDYDLLFNQTWGLAYDPQSTIAAFTAESSYYHATSGIPQVEQLYRKIDEVMVAGDEQVRQALYDDILTIVHEEAVFIPLTNGNLTVVAPAGLKGLSFKQTQFELPFELMAFE